jgi:hypothetical protein
MIGKLRPKIKGHPKHDAFWQELVATGTSLLDEAEAGEGGVTTEEREAFLTSDAPPPSAPAAPPSAAPQTAADSDSDEDFDLDDMMG